MPNIKYVTEKFPIEQLLEKKRYIFARLATKKEPNVATIQVDRTAINQAKKRATTTTLEEGIKASLGNFVVDNSEIYKKKYDKNSNTLIEDEENEVPVARVTKKIVKYPEVLMSYLDRSSITANEYDFKRNSIDFKEKMTLDGNNYHLAGVMYHSGLHFWSHVKSIDDGQWYEANDRKITKIGKEIMPFVRGEKAIKGGTRGQEDLRSAAIIWMYVKEEKDS